MNQNLKKLYVLVDSNLELAYQGVQAGHAVAQWLIDNPSQDWNNNTLVYLGVKNLESWKNKLDRLSIKYSLFKEPDIGNELTSIATYSDGKLFRNLNLMGS